MRPLALLLALLPAATPGVDPQPAAPSAVRSVGTAAGARVGPETCKACHAAAYDVWRNGPHARAFEGLPAQSRKDPRCLSCHSPDADAGLAGVSCESCHGPGRLYAAPYVMRDAELSRALGLQDPGEKTCVACHTDSTPSLVKFEYGRKLALMRHGKEPPPQPAAPPRKATAPKKGP